MKNKLVTVLALTMSLGLVSCKKSYLDGFAAGELQGYNNGYDDGYADGYDVGWENAKTYFASADYTQGFADGQASGITIGYNNGHAAGLSQGLNTGYNNGYNDGYSDGDDNGFARGQTSGYNLGYDDGFADGVDYGMDPAALTAAYNSGYNDGFDDGYDLGIFDGYNVGFDDGYNFGFGDGYDIGFGDGYNIGYDDGYYDGSWGFSGTAAVASTTDLDGLPHNNMNNANPKVTLAATLASDLVDMKKVKTLEEAYLKGFKQSIGVLEETQMTSKDLNKLAAAKEAFRVKQLSQDIVAEYGLSQERAEKIAKLSLVWRKSANTRAITAEDADAFSENLIGVNIKEIESAYKKTLKGEMGDLTAVLRKAAEVNQISEFHASRLMLKLFL